MSSANHQGTQSDTLAVSGSTNGFCSKRADPSLLMHGMLFGTGRFWNYLRRQLFVLDTYSTPHNRKVNRTLFLVHFYLSSGFVLAVVTAWACLAHALLPPLYSRFDLQHALAAISRFLDTNPCAIAGLLTNPRGYLDW